MNQHTTEEDDLSPYADARADLLDRGQGTPGRLHEVRLLVVGPSGSGKTSLVRLLRGGDFEPQVPPTPGIARSTMEITCEEKGGVRVNVWDFGGSETLHAAHQLFFTSRCVYLLVMDGSGGARGGGLEYWLEWIRAHAGDAPVVLACTKCDAQPMKLELERLRERHPQIKACVPGVSCSGGGPKSLLPGHGVPALRAALASVLDRHVDINRAFRPEWLALKASLEKDARAFLTFDQYDSVCAESGVEIHDREPLLAMLNELGTMLHFGAHPVVRDKQVMHPDWLIAALYAILHDEALHRNGGLLSRADLQRILSTIRDHHYAPRHEEYLLEFLRKSELCHPAHEGVVVLTDLLPATPPLLELPPEVPAFRYQYRALNPSVPRRLLAKMHRSMVPGGCWRGGFVLQHGDNRSLVKVNEAKETIDLFVDGPRTGRRNALDAIRSALEAIHSSFPHGSKVRELVPVPGDENEWIDVASLLRAQANGDELYSTKSHGKVPIAVLLQDVAAAVETGEEPRRFGVRNPIGTETMVSRGILFPSAPSSRPRQEKAGTTDARPGRGALVAGGAGLGAIAAAMVVFPGFWPQLLLGAAAVAAAVAAARGAVFPHRSMAGVTLGVMAGANAAGFGLRAAGTSSAHGWSDGTAIAFTATCCLVLLVLLMLEPQGGPKEDQ